MEKKKRASVTADKNALDNQEEKAAEDTTSSKVSMMVEEVGDSTSDSKDETKEDAPDSSSVPPEKVEDIEPPQIPPEENEPTTSTPTEPMQPQKEETLAIPVEKSNRRLFTIGLVAFIATLITAGAYIAYSFSTKRSAEMEDELLALTPTVVPVSPTPALDRLIFKLEVLNGSGVAGAAASAASTLSSRGYPIIRIGNADKSDYENTQVFIAKDLVSQEESLLKDFAVDFPSASNAGELKNSTASARIIVGKNK